MLFPRSCGYHPLAMETLQPPLAISPLMWVSPDYPNPAKSGERYFPAHVGITPLSDNKKAPTGQDEGFFSHGLLCFIGYSSLTPWLAIFATSIYRPGIAKDDQPPASCKRSNAVPFRAAWVAQ